MVCDMRIMDWSADVCSSDLDLGERLAARLFFHVADRVLGVGRFPESGNDRIAAAAQVHVLEEVDDDPVDRHHRHEDQGERNHPLDDVLSRVGDHFVDQMVDTHLGESSGAVASGGDGGFLQHDAYIWMWWFGVCLARWDGCCEWNWLSGADLMISRR